MLILVPTCMFYGAVMVSPPSASMKYDGFRQTKTDRQTARQTSRQTDRQKDGQTNRQTDRQTGRQTYR